MRDVGLASVDETPARGDRGAMLEGLAPRQGHGHGRGTVVARQEGARTVLTRVHATSPLRFVRPTFPGSRAASVCLVTFGGGLVDGDTIEVDLRVEAGATLVVFTQATTKAFRGSSTQHIRAEVHGTLVFLPDPVACFARSRFRQRVDITLHGEGSAVTLDGFTSGRAAFGERWAFDAVDLTTTVRDGDQRVLVRDALRLDRADGPIETRIDRFEALATVLAVGPRVVAGRTRAARRRASPRTRSSPLRAPCPPAPTDPALAPSSASPQRARRTRSTRPARRLRNLPDIDVVDPFASRH